MRNSLNDTPNLVQSASQENHSPNFPSLIKNPLNSASDDLIDSDYNNVETEVHQLFSKNTYQPKFIEAMASKKSSSISSKFHSSEDSLSEPENLKTSNQDVDNYKRNPFSIHSGSNEGHSLKFKTATFTEFPLGAISDSKTLKIFTKRVSSDQEIRSPSFNHAIGKEYFKDGATKSLFQSLSPQNTTTKIQFFKQEVKDDVSIKGESTGSLNPPEKQKPIKIPPLRPQPTMNSGAISSHRNKQGWKEGYEGGNFLTRAKIRAAFARAIGDNIFNATNAELRLIKDKSYVMSLEAKKDRRKKNGKRKLPKMKDVLEKHGIIRDGIKRSEMQKILRDIGRSRTIKESLIRQYLVLRKYLENNWILNYIKKVIVMTIIDPYSYFRIGWDVGSLLLIFYDLMLIPFQMGFNLAIKGFFLRFELFEDIFFIVDVLLNLRTGFYLNGVLIRKNREIMLHYLKTWFALDAVAIITSTLFLDIFFDDDELNESNSFRLLRFVRFIRFLRVLRALRLKKLFQKVDDMFYSNFYNTLKSLASLLFYIALVAHLSACLWYFVADTFGDYFGDSWIYHGGYAEMSVMARYTVSLFWAVTTMLTVGYGDITPMNTLERAVNIIIMLVGCGVFAYSMNKIGMLVQSLNAQASETRQMYYNVIQYMDKMNVSKGLRHKVTQYLDYMKQNQKYSRFGGEQVFSILSDNLRDEIRKDINGQVLREDKILLKNFGSKFLSILSYKLEEKNFSPNEIIFDEIDKSCSLYFVTTGSVEIYLRSCDTVISQIQGGSHFGELSFFTGRSRTAAARSSTFAHILYIPRDSFLHLVQDFPLEEETYHFIKDQMSIYNNYSMISVQCTVCGQNSHDARGCPRVHYVPDRQNILKNYQKTSADFMKNFKRKTRKKFRGLKDNPTIVIQARTWCNDHPKEVKKLGSNGSFRQPKLSNISAVSPRHPMKNDIIAELHRRRNLIRPLHTIMLAKKFSGSPDELSPQLQQQPDSIFKKSSYNKQPAPRIAKKASDPVKIASRNYMSDNDEDENKTNNSIFPTKVHHPAAPLRFQQQEYIPPSERGSFLGAGKFPVCPIRYDSNQPISSRTGLDENNYARAIEESLLNYELQQRLDEYQRQQALQMAFEREVVFDLVCNYKVYFPHNNISTLLEEMKKKQDEKNARSKILDEEKKKVRKVNSMKIITSKKKSSSITSLSFAAFKLGKSEKHIHIPRKDSDADSESSARRYHSPKRPEIKNAFNKKHLQPQTTLGNVMGSEYLSSIMD